MVSLDDPAQEALAAQWEALEVMVIAVSRDGQAAAEEAQFGGPRRRSEAHYASWREALAPHWKATPIDGRETAEDPFASLPAEKQVADFVGNCGPLTGHF